MKLTFDLHTRRAAYRFRLDASRQTHADLQREIAASFDSMPRWEDAKQPVAEAPHNRGWRNA